ncbi:MAG: hypothetical protein Kow0080_30960 [Candidatus Promineifilaceae bacterium]
MTLKRLHRVELLAVLIIVIVLGVTAVNQTIAQTPQGAAPSGPFCRFGVNALEDPAQTNLPAYNIGWYMNFTAHAVPSKPNSMEYMPTIRIQPSQNNAGYTYTPSGTALTTTIAGNPGAKWLISNEPDSIWQDNLTPERYANAYHELYYLIKTADPTAKIIAGNIIQATALRLQYMDAILTTYYNNFNEPFPTDGWSIHNYILSEVDCNFFPPEYCWGAFIPPGSTAISGEIWQYKDHDRLDIFTERIVRFRQWLADRGYGGQPVYLTEYGILFPALYHDENGQYFDAPRVKNFMTATFDYLNSATDTKLGDPNDGYRLVQQWSWFSTTDPNYNGMLFESPAPYTPTVFISHYGNYTSQLAPEVDFYPSKVEGFGVSTGTAVTVTVSATIANSGNLVNNSGATVTFYNGDPQNGGSIIGTPQTIQLNGCGSNQTISIQWPNLPPGTHTIYVQVTPDSGVTETNTTNNTVSGTVLVATEQIYLPAIQRGLP